MAEKQTKQAEAIKKLISEVADEELSQDKNIQFFRLDRADKYNRGLQYIALGENASGAWTFDQVGAPVTPSDATREEAGLYDYNIDVVATYGFRWTAVLGLRPFYHVKAVPDDPQSEDDRRAARQAEIAKLWLHAQWKVAAQNIEIASREWSAGTVWLYTPYGVDEEMFGTSEEPVLGSQTVEIAPAGYRCINCGARSAELLQDEGTGISICPECSYPSDPNAYEQAETADVPMVTGYEEYPNGGVHFYLCDGFTVTVPFHATSTEPWLLYEYEEYQGTLLRLYPELRELMKSGEGQTSRGTSDEEVGPAARAGTESLLGYQRAKSPLRWTYSRYWLSPAALEMIVDEHEDERKQLISEYPRGLKVVMVDNIVLPDRFEHEAAKDVWVPVKPRPGRLLYNDPVCWGILPHQDLRNDMWNMAVEHLERGLPKHIVEVGLLDIDAINESRFLPNEIVETKTSSGSLDSKIKTLQAAKFPDQVMTVISGAETAVQDYSGLQPRVFGGAEAASHTTAEQARLDLNQALTQLGTPGVFMTDGWVDASTNAVKQLEKHGEKNVKVAAATSKGGTAEMLDFDVLRSGKWHFEGHPGLPQTYAERRDALQQLVKENPELATKLGIGLPVNSGAIQDHLGLPEMKNPDEDLRQKVLEIIQQLAEDGKAGAGPVEEPMPDGSMIYLPSIPPEAFVDNHALVAELTREYLVSEQGRKLKQDNPQGYQNVKAYGQAQERMIPPPPMEGAPPGPQPTAKPSSGQGEPAAVEGPMPVSPPVGQPQPDQSQIV